MSPATVILLELLAAADDDGTLADLGIDGSAYDRSDLEAALRRWRDAGYPDIPKHPNDRGVCACATRVLSSEPGVCGTCGEPFVELSPVEVPVGLTVAR